MTCREELAAFAATRGNCLFDNFQFVPAVEAYYLAHKIAPHKRCLNDAWGLAVYSSKLWARVCSLPDELQNLPLEQAFTPEAKKLVGPDAEFFRQPAIENLLRIIRNRKRRDQLPGRDAAFQALTREASHV